MAGILVGYVRCSTDKQGLDAQQKALAALGPPPRGSASISG